MAEDRYILHSKDLSTATEMIGSLLRKPDGTIHVCQRDSLDLDLG
jgi:hypothetical protein